jgi:tRNA(Ile)-lysidine synthase
MLNAFRNTIKKYTMLTHGDAVGIAFSGGPDSSALLYGLLSVAEEYGLTLMILHMNHGLRMPEAEQEEIFVHDQGRTLGIPVITRKVSIPELREREGGSLEDICRRERYRFFQEEAARHHIGKIALGHNRNDQAETVMMRFLRGSGPDGLKGMLPVREGMYIRPLIETSREEIDRFLLSKGVPFVIDASNEESFFLRNRVRHTLLRNLERNYNSNLIDTLCRLSDVMRMENDFMECAVDACVGELISSSSRNEITIDITIFRALHEALQYRVMRKLLKRHAGTLKEIGYAHVEAAVKLVHGDSPQARLDLPGGMTVYRDYERVTIQGGEKDVPWPKKVTADKKRTRLQGDKQEGNDYDYNVTIPGVVDIKEVGREMKLEYVDRGKVCFRHGGAAYIDMGAVTPPLRVRNLRVGDVITPLGMKGTKSLKSIFIDEKIPRRERHLLPLLVDGLSVIWVPGIRLHDRVKVTDMTDTIVRIEMI